MIWRHGITWLCHALLVLYAAPRAGQGASVILMPFPWESHVAEISSIGHGLVDNGHSVYIMLSASYPNNEHMRSSTNFTVRIIVLFVPLET